MSRNAENGQKLGSEPDSCKLGGGNKIPKSIPSKTEKINAVIIGETGKKLFKDKKTIVSKSRPNLKWEIQIPRRAISWNKYYAGLHWAKRKALTDEWHDEVLTALYLAKIPRVSPKQRIIVTIAVSMKQPIDPDNICAKVIIDGLVKWGFLPDDTYKSIAEVRLKVAKYSQDFINITLECVDNLP